MIYYKVVRGYGPDDYITIDQQELEKAQYAFLYKKDVIFHEGAVRASDIIAIQPDYNKTMGWNRGYKLQAEDYSDIRDRGIDNKARNLLAEATDKIAYLIKNNQQDLIGKNVDIKMLD